MGSNYQESFTLFTGTTQESTANLESILKELGAINLEPLLEDQDIVNDMKTLPNSLFNHSPATTHVWDLEESTSYLEGFPSPPAGYKKYSDALANMLRKRLPPNLSHPSYSHNLVDDEPINTVEPSFAVSARFGIIFRLILSDGKRQQQDVRSINSNNGISNQENDAIKLQLCTDLSLANYKTELTIGQCTFKVDLTDPVLCPKRVGRPNSNREYCAYLAYTILNGFNDQEMENLVKGDCISGLPSKIEETPLQLSIAIAQHMETSIEFVIEKYKEGSFAASVHIDCKRRDKVSAHSTKTSTNVIDVLKDAATRICHHIDPSFTVDQPAPMPHGRLQMDSDAATNYLNTTESLSPSPSSVYYESHVNNKRNYNDAYEQNATSHISYYINHCARLEELCQQLGYERPIYDAQEAVGSMFSCTITIQHRHRRADPPVVVNTGGNYFLGAKAAKNCCAQLAINRLQSINLK